MTILIGEPLDPFLPAPMRLYRLPAWFYLCRAYGVML